MWGFKARLALSDVLLRLGERVAPPYRWRSDWADHPPTERVYWREPMPEDGALWLPANVKQPSDPVFVPRRPSDHAPVAPATEQFPAARSLWRWRDGATSPWSWR
jgi:hypothetical protein